MESKLEEIFQDVLCKCIDFDEFYREIAAICEENYRDGYTKGYLDRRAEDTQT